MHVRCWDVIVPSSIAVSTSCSDALRRSRELSPFIFISPVITRNEIGINASMEIPGHGQQLYSSVTVLHQKRAYTHSGNSRSKRVHQNLLLTAHAYMHFVLKWDWMRTPICGGVRIQSHFNTKCIHAWGNNNRIWCMHLGQEVPEWVYALFWCKTVVYQQQEQHRMTKNILSKKTTQIHIKVQDGTWTFEHEFLKKLIMRCSPKRPAFNGLFIQGNPFLTQKTGERALF